MNNFQSILISFILLVFAICFTVSCVYFVRIIAAKANDAENLSYREYNDQITSITGLQGIIDNTIDIYVAHRFKEVASTSKTYDILNIDKDCASIAHDVYNIINKDFLRKSNEWNTIVTSDFWMNYIIRKTTLSVLAAVKQINIMKEESRL